MEETKQDIQTQREWHSMPQNTHLFSFVLYLTDTVFQFSYTQLIIPSGPQRKRENLFFYHCWIESIWENNKNQKNKTKPEYTKVHKIFTICTFGDREGQRYALFH